MRKPYLFVFAASLALSACTDGYEPFYIRAHIPDQLTTEGLLTLREGMAYDDVEKLIGPPVCWDAEALDWTSRRS